MSVLDQMIGENPQCSRIGFLEKLGFSAMSMTDGITSQFVATFILFFFTDVCGIAPGAAGIIATAGMLWDGVNDPLIGYYADNHRFKSGEKARPFALFFGIPTAVSFVLLFTVFDISPMAKIIYAFVIYMIYRLFITFFLIPGNVMKTLATSDPAARVSINTFASLGANIGTVVATLAVWPLIELFGGGINEEGGIINQRRGFFMVAVILGVLVVGGSLLHYFTTRERVKPVNPDISRIKLNDMMRMLFSTKSWTANMLYLLFSNIHNLIISITVVYLATSVLGDSGMVTPLMAGYLGGAVVALPFIGPIHKKLGRRKTMLVTTILLIISKLYFVFTTPSLLSGLVVAVFVGIGVSISLVMTSTSSSEIADLVEFRKGRRIENILSTISTLVIKLALALVTLLVGAVFQYAGYDASLNTQPAGAMTAIKVFFGIVPLLAAVIMFFIACFFPIEREMDEMMAAKAVAAAQGEEK